MKTTLIKSFKYNGMFIKNKELPESEQREVEILGVMCPPDPGFVTILDQGKQKQVPTFVLKECPRINFGKLLTAEQKSIRDKLGILPGNGVGGKPVLLPLADCPIYTQAEIEAERAEQEEDSRRFREELAKRNPELAAKLSNGTLGQ
jgi:hypothetical protein